MKQVVVRANIACLEARDTKTSARVAGMYCKVYARLRGSRRTVFYKDGYTDICGEFWYGTVD
jgi:hypothetical protein